MCASRVHCIQPRITHHDYRDKNAFRDCLEKYLSRASQRFAKRGKGGGSKANIVVLPEMIGTWLVMADEPVLQRVGLFDHRYDHVVMRMIPYMLPMLLVVLVHSPAFLYIFLRQFALSSMRRLRAAGHEYHSGSGSMWQLRRRQLSHLIQMYLSLSFWIGLLSRVLMLCKAERTLQIYVSTFAELAQKYECHIVAGSILLPRCPQLDNVTKGKDRTDAIGQRTGKDAPRLFAMENLDEGLYNMGMVFDTRGNIVHISHKQYPVGEEIHILNMDWQRDKAMNDKDNEEETNVADRLKKSARKNRFGTAPREKSVFHCEGIGNVGVLICADSWYPESYEPLIKAQCRLVVVPSFSTPASAFFRSWSGYSNVDNIFPEDVDKRDVFNSTLSAAWEKYALAGLQRIGKMKKVIGVCCHCVCYICADLTASGQSYICTSAKTDGEEHCKIVQRAPDPFDECILMQNL